MNKVIKPGPDQQTHKFAKKVVSARNGEPRDFDNNTLISANQIAVRANVTVGTVWFWSRNNPQFPSPLKLSARCTRWRKSEIDDWLDSRVAA